MNRDNTIFELIEKEHQRQLKGIELIASENLRKRPGDGSHGILPD